MTKFNFSLNFMNLICRRDAGEWSDINIHYSSLARFTENFFNFFRKNWILIMSRCCSIVKFIKSLAVTKASDDLNLKIFGWKTFCRQAGRTGESINKATLSLQWKNHFRKFADTGMRKRSALAIQVSMKRIKITKSWLKYRTDNWKAHHGNERALEPDESRLMSVK